MIEYSATEDAAIIEFRRPEKRNSLSLGAMREFVDCVERAERECRVAVVRGAGDAFCAGADLDALASVESEEDAREFASTVVDFFLAPERADVPVLAAVNGDAYGAGFELVTAADLAVATRGAEFGMPATNIGVYAPYTAERVALTAGRKRMMELVLTAEPIDAMKAREWGVVNEVVESGGFSDAVDRLVTQVSGAVPGAVAATKEAVRSGFSGDERERMVGTLTELIVAPETRERVREVQGE